VLLASALLAASLLAKAGDPAAVYLANARKALEAGNVEKAKSQLNLAVKANPQSADVWLMLAGAEMQNGESARAIEHFQHALRLAPDSFAGHYDLALAYLHERKLSDARSELERAVTLKPRQPDAAYNLGMVLLEMENARESVKYLQRARSLEPRRPDVAFNLVRAELAAGDWPAARDEARNSAHTFAGDAGWYGSVGKLFLESGHAQDAALLLRDALRLSASEEVRRLLASAYLQTQQPDLVLSLIPEPKTPDERFLCGSALLIKHHLAEAESEAAKLLEMAPNEARYLLLAARIQQFQGHQDQALELLRRAAGHAPRWAEPYYCMAVSYYFERRYDDARRALNESLQRSPNSSRSLFLFAVTLINQGKNREAEAYLRRAIAIQPDNARYRVHLGAALLRDDRPAG
jgi:Flp pilus assembly protein TadD